MAENDSNSGMQVITVAPGDAASLAVLAANGGDAEELVRLSGWSADALANALVVLGFALESNGLQVRLGGDGGVVDGRFLRRVRR